MRGRRGDRSDSDTSGLDGVGSKQLIDSIALAKAPKAKPYSSRRTSWISYSFCAPHFNRSGFASLRRSSSERPCTQGVSSASFGVLGSTLNGLPSYRGVRVALTGNESAKHQRFYCSTLFRLDIPEFLTIKAQECGNITDFENYFTSSIILLLTYAA